MTTVTFEAQSHTGAPLGATFGALISCVRALFAPAIAAQRQSLDEATRTTDAARVRRLAQSLMAEDPRFASDLLAAADRHELG